MGKILHRHFEVFSAEPLLPRSRSNPIGQVRLIRKTVNKVNKRLTQVQDWLIKQLDDIPVNEIQINRVITNDRVYEYLIDANSLQQIIDRITEVIGEVPNRAVVDAVRTAYESGTATAVENLRRIADEYNKDLMQVLASQPYQRRVALIESRVFEEMLGLGGDLKAELARVLSGGVENGFNPRKVAKDIKARIGVSKSRAERIARTEIGQAQRRARLDEAQDAQERLGIRIRMLWLSALSPTTRERHARRHGQMYTPQEVREFYSRDANAINCKCAQTEALVDENGDPVTPGVVKKVRAYGP